MKKNALIVSNLRIFFVEDDLRIISEFTNADLWNTAENGLIRPGLIKKILNSDIIYCWFASLHSFFPALLARLTGKKLVVVSGGYDIANISDIRYGHAGHPVKRIISRTILNIADRVIVNSSSSAEELKQFFPEVVDKTDVILHRIDYKDPEQLPERDEKLVITVMRMNSMNYARKKTGLMKEVARLLPDYRFVHIGKILDEAKPLFYNNLPENFESVGYVTDEELWQWYHKAGFLIAPSWHEGFGLTAVEALAAGCLPVISGTGAQEEVTKGEAVIIPSDDPQAWADKIRSMEFSQEERENRKQVIRNAYPKDKRPEEIERVFRELFDV